MFSIAVWDKKLKNLFLIRDRIGIKPLFFYFDSKNFAFASEIKALRKLPWLDFSIDKQALSSYVRLNYVPSPHSIFTKIKNLNQVQFSKLTLIKKFPSKNIGTLYPLLKNKVLIKTY